MYARDDKGLFNTDLSGKSKDDKKWLLTQAAMIEMSRPPCHYPINFSRKNDN